MKCFLGILVAVMFLGIPAFAADEPAQPAAAPEVAQAAPAPEAPNKDHQAQACPLPIPCPECPEQKPCPPPVACPECVKCAECPKPAEGAIDPSLKAEAMKAHIAYLRDVVEHIVKKDMDDKDIVNVVIRDLDDFIETYRDVPGSEEALLLRSRLSHLIEHFEAELVSLAKIIFEYNDSQFRANADAGIKQLFKDKLNKDWRSDLELLKGSDKASRADRCADLLVALNQLSRKDYLDLQLREYDEFLRRYPLHERADLVLTFRIANYQKREEFESTAFSMKRLADFYPKSKLRAETLFALGNVFSDELKDYQQSAMAFERVYTEHAGSSHEVLAYEKAAQLYYKRLANPAKAIEALEAIVTKFPSTDNAFNAFKLMAQIQEEGKEYAKSAESLLRFSVMFREQKQPDAIQAIRYAAGLYEKRLSDYLKAVETLNLVYERYPGKDDAAEALYAMAELYEKKLNMPEKATEYYNLTSNKYPGHKLGIAASKWLEKQQQKK